MNIFVYLNYLKKERISTTTLTKTATEKSMNIIFIVAGFIEELVNTELLDKKKIKNKYLRIILKFRPILEITVFIASLVTGIWIMWFTLLLFDIGYNGIRIAFEMIE